MKPKLFGELRYCVVAKLEETIASLCLVYFEASDSVHFASEACQFVICANAYSSQPLPSSHKIEREEAKTNGNLPSQPPLGGWVSDQTSTFTPSARAS